MSSFYHIVVQLYLELLLTNYHTRHMTGEKELLLEMTRMEMTL